MGLDPGRTAYVHSMMHQTISYNTNGSDSSQSGSVVDIANIALFLLDFLLDTTITTTYTHDRGKYFSMKR